MSTALVGSGGFVGGNLISSGSFTDMYGSANSAAMAGRHYDTVVFAAARAEKWRINQDPARDLVHIDELKKLISSFTTDRLVLVSTVDVYPTPIGVDETSAIDANGLHPYGLHRFELEQHAAFTHPKTTVIRLPGLFGVGLKKNVIFDLLHSNNLERIHRAGSFQYYNLNRLSADIDRAVGADLKLVHLVSEPIRTDELAAEAFGLEFAGEPAGIQPALYDVRTVHGATFKSPGFYTYDKATTLADLAAFVSAERKL